MYPSRKEKFISCVLFSISNDALSMPWRDLSSLKVLHTKTRTKIYYKFTKCNISLSVSLQVGETITFKGKTWSYCLSQLSQNEDYHRYSNARVPFLREGNFEGQAFPFEFKFRNTELQIGIEYKYQSRNT